MRVDYFNAEQRIDCARVTAIGRDARGRSRRPIMDLYATDLSALIDIAKGFRQKQQLLATENVSRANTITRSLQEDS